jgi:hypothetical protein
MMRRVLYELGYIRKVLGKVNKYRYVVEVEAYDELR